MAKVTTTTAISANPVKRNGATVIYGTTRNNVVTNAPARTFVGYKDTKGSFINRVIPNLHDVDPLLNFTKKALSTGNFAKMLPRKYIIRRVTTELAGVSKTAIYMGPVIKWNQSIHYVGHRNTEQNIRRRDLNIVWDMLTGLPTTNIGMTRDNFGADDAAHPTYLIPGELVYMNGHRSGPRQADYAARNEF